MTVRAVFMGSDPFSVPILSALIQRGPGLARPISTVGVVTQPDRPSGRGRKIAPGPVKVLAAEHNIPVLQPDRHRTEEQRAPLAALRPDVIVVAAFGQLLPDAVLSLAPHGCLNLHPSLLPRWRGPAPVAAALLAGDEVTGTSLMLLVKRMDAGPVIRQISTAIRADEVAGELEARLAGMSAGLLIETLPDWLDGRAPAAEQDEAEATYIGKITREDALLDWRRPAEELVRQVRAFNPWPVAHSFWGSRALQILRATATESGGEPGMVLGVRGDGLEIACGEGSLVATEVKPAGSRAMSGAQLARGHAAVIGSRLGA